MTEPSLLTIPQGVLLRVELALHALRRWNDAVEHARSMEVVARQPGRYEYDLRYTSAGQTQRQQLVAALATLAQFAERALSNGVDAEVVYAHLGGRTALLDEGAHVQDWHPSEA